MSVVVTGLHDSLCKAVVSKAGINRLVFRPVSEVLSAARGHAGLGRSERVVWLYRTPWLLANEEDTGTNPPLEQWLSVHRAVLRARRTLGNKLMLVNADQVSPFAVLSELGLQSKAAENGTAQADVIPVGAFPADLLMTVFNAIAPEYGDVFEALEALSWRPDEDVVAPAYTNVPSSEALQEVVRLLTDGHAATGLHEMLVQAQQEIEVQKVETASLRAELQQRIAQQTSEAREVARLAQLVQKEQAAHRDLSAQLQQERARAAEVQADQSAEIATLRADLQRRAVPDNRGDAREAARLAQLVQSEQAARRDLASQLQQERARVTELQAEQELLMQQMQQVQEELERYFLENRHLQCAIRESQQAMDAARCVISSMLLGADAKGQTPWVLAQVA